MSKHHKGLNQLGKVVDSKGQTVAEMFGPPNALTSQANELDQGLYALTETIIRGLMPDERGGGLGGKFGNGVNFENEIFMIHRFCWCEKEDGSCLYCIHGDHPDFHRLLKEKWGTTDYQKHRARHYYDPPLFWHKASDFRVTWYKWIGRDTATNRAVTVGEWSRIFIECFESIPAEARAKAKAEHDYENTPEYKAKREEKMNAFFKAMAEMDSKEEP